MTFSTSTKRYLESAKVKNVEQSFFLGLENYVFNVESTPETHLLSRKILKNTSTLNNFLNVKEGIKTGNDKIFLSENPFEENSFEILKGRNVNKYFNKPKLYINYDTNKLNRPQKKELFQSAEKLLIRRVGKDLVATYDDKQLFCVHTLYVANQLNVELYSIKFFLALLNSKLMNFFYHSNNLKKGDTFPEVRIYSINSLPIRTIDFSQPKEKAAHDKIVELAAKMLEAKKQLSDAQTDKDKTFYERYCSSLDTQIDALVYDLYELSPDERKIIESA